MKFNSVVKFNRSYKKIRLGNFAKMTASHIILFI